MTSATTPPSGTGNIGSSLSLGTKLGAGFAVLTLVTALLGIFALSRMSAMNDSARIIRDNSLASTAQSGQLAVALMDARRGEIRMILAATDADREAASSRILAAIASVDQRRADYDKLVDPGEERNRYTSVFDVLWPQFKQADAEMRAHQSSMTPQAKHDYFYGESSKVVSTLRDFMIWDMDHNAASGKQQADVSRNVYATTRTLLIGGIVLALLLSIATAIGLIRHISHPLAAMAAAMRALADRDMTGTIPSAGRGDEIGAMAAVMQVFKDSMMTADRLAIEQATAQEVRQQRSARLEDLVGNFEREVGGTVSIIAAASTELKTTASSMTSTADKTNQQALAVSRAAENSSSGVQTVAAASEELAASISEINRQVTASASLTGKAVSNVRRTDDTVRALSESADRIGKVIELITGIASQTNLLALNATIEAARAGDAGKGFAVVASEVKHLAQQTARATDEISLQIKQVQQATASAVDAIREIGGIIEEVGIITTSIAAAVEQQGAATSEIARNVQQTAASTHAVTSNIAGVSLAANDTGTAAGQVLSAAGDLSRQAEQLSMEVGRFITSVRTA